MPPKLAKNVALFKAAEDGTESVTAVLRALAGTQAVSRMHPSSSSSDPALRKRAAALYGEQKNGRTALHVAIEKRERPVASFGCLFFLLLPITGCVQGTPAPFLSLDLSRSRSPSPGVYRAHPVCLSQRHRPRVRYSAIGTCPLVLGTAESLLNAAVTCGLGFRFWCDAGADRGRRAP